MAGTGRQLWNLFAPTAGGELASARDAEHPSSLLLPVVDTPALGDPPACGDLVAMRCVQPAG